MIAKLIWKMDDSHEREDFEASLKGSHYKMKIDELYQEVFRPFMKHGVSFIGNDGNPDKEFKLMVDDGYGTMVEMTADQVQVGVIESAIVEAIWQKVFAYFNEE